MAKRNGRWEDAGKFLLDFWSPLDSQVVKLVPMSASPASTAANQSCASSSLEAMQMTLAAGDGSIHTVTLDLPNARKLSQMILNRLAEFGDAAAQELVSLIQKHKRQDNTPPPDDREAA
jgi:hypothetical protein